MVAPGVMLKLAGAGAMKGVSDQKASSTLFVEEKKKEKMLWVVTEFLCAVITSGTVV